MKNQKEWWAPIWKGLVMDQGAKHYRTMGKALWLLLYLILNADRRTGLLIRKTKTIASDTGIKERRIRQWLKALKRKGYIRTRNTGRCLYIRIEKWKGLPARQDYGSQSDKSMPGRLTKPCRSGKSIRGQNSSHSSRKSLRVSLPNDRTIKKDILKIDIDNKKISESDFNAFKEFKPRTKEELLALDLATALDDHQALPLYLYYSNRHSESLLRKVLGEVKEVPTNKIKRNRAALFNYLIQRYEKRHPENLSH